MCIVQRINRCTKLLLLGENEMSYNATNEATQLHLQQLMLQAKERGFNFTRSGMHYLACRVNGSRYRKAILAGFTLMLAGKLHETLPAELLQASQKALNREVLPEEAILIFATGRKPLMDAAKTHWQEEQSSLLNFIELTEEQLSKLPKDKQNKIKLNQNIRKNQRDVCVQLLNFLSDQYDLEHAETETTVPAKPKKAKVIKMKTKPPLHNPHMEGVINPKSDPNPEILMTMYGIPLDVFDNEPEDIVIPPNIPATPTTKKVARPKKVTVK